jgi:hypothetical protein
MTEFNEIANTTVCLATTEIGLGSMIHALHLPMGGHLLALNQGVLLARLSGRTRDRITAFRCVIQTSVFTAVLKSLSPIGKTLGPMVSICAQGFLFGVGNLVLGRGVAGRTLGMSFLSVWGFVQPFLTYRIIYGQPFLDALQFMNRFLGSRFSVNVNFWIYFLGGLVLSKLLFGAALIFLTQSWSQARWELWDAQMMKTASASLQPTRVDSGNIVLGIFKDLTQPLFLVSMALMFVFFCVTEKVYVNALWLMLRPLAISIVLFAVLRSGIVIGILQRWCLKSLPDLQWDLKFDCESFED